MNRIDINPEELKSIFAVIGLSNKEGIQYRQRMSKHRQVFDFLIHIEKAINNLSKERTLTIVDCASGRSYLSFITNYYLFRVLNKKVEFTCIDYNNHVIEQSKKAAESLGFDNMNFICNDIFKVQLNKKPDIIYSLHACNKATDMTISKGIFRTSKIYYDCLLLPTFCKISYAESSIDINYEIWRI